MCNPSKFTTVCTHSSETPCLARCPGVPDEGASIWICEVSTLFPSCVNKPLVLDGQGVSVLTTNYFDDFITLGHDTKAASLTACIHMFFNLLAGPLHKRALRRLLWASRYEGLGTLGNTDHRREELLQTLDNILTAKTLVKGRSFETSWAPPVCCRELVRPRGQGCIGGGVSSCVWDWL